MASFNDLYKMAALAMGGYTSGLYQQTFSDGDQLFFLPLEQNKKGSWSGLQVMWQAGKRKPDKAKETNVPGRDINKGSSDPHALYKLISPEKVPVEVQQRFADRADEFVAPVAKEESVQMSIITVLENIRKSLGEAEVPKLPKAKKTEAKKGGCSCGCGSCGGKTESAWARGAIDSLRKTSSK